MAWDVVAVVGARDWVTREQLLEQVSRGTVAHWLAAGRLVRIDTGRYALPLHARHWRTRVAAALDCRRAVASHATALALWGLVEHPPGPVHVTVDLTRSARGTPGVVVHRSERLEEWRRVGGLAVAPVERALVDAWGSPAPLRREDLRAAVIEAVGRRSCRPDDIARELARRSRLTGRAELARLVALLADGCRSELEIWGCLHVLRAPGMPPFSQQRPVTVGRERFILDAAYDEAQLGVELDGAAWHGSREQRERDIRRDALLATAGWQTLRFGYRRLTASPDDCRRDILAARSARQRLLSGNGVR